MRIFEDDDVDDGGVALLFCVFILMFTNYFVLKNNNLDSNLREKKNAKNSVKCNFEEKN